VRYFRKLGIDTSGIRMSKSYRTPTKMRILAGAVHSQRQQIVRLDSGGPIANTLERPFLERKLKSHLPGSSALMVSDYGYGWIKPDLVSNIAGSRIVSTIDSRFSLTEFTGM